MLSHTLGVPMVLTGHSLGRNKLEHLMKVRRVIYGRITFDVLSPNMIYCLLKYQPMNIGDKNPVRPRKWPPEPPLKPFLSILAYPFPLPLACTQVMGRRQAEETYRMGRRIEAEERAFDAAVFCVTSTQQEIDAQ
jgi:hypothetical protein